MPSGSSFYVPFLLAEGALLLLQLMRVQQTQVVRDRREPSRSLIGKPSAGKHIYMARLTESEFKLRYRLNVGFFIPDPRNQTPESVD